MTAEPIALDTALAAFASELTVGHGGELTIGHGSSANAADERQRGGCVSRLLHTDTGAFLALIYGRDRAHGRVTAHLRALTSAGDRLITCEPVISETVTRLRFDAGLPRVAAFRSVL